MMAKPIRALELHYPMIQFLTKYNKTKLYLGVNVLSMKVLIIVVTILISHWRRDCHFMWSCGCLAVCGAKTVPSFRSFFKTLRMCHFRVPPGLCIKTRLSIQPLIWKWFFILMQIKLIFTTKVVHFASFWNRGFLELGSGPLVRPRKPNPRHRLLS